MPVYEEKIKVNGQKRWFIRTYITNELGEKKQITKHNKDWIGLSGKKLAEEEEFLLSRRIPQESDKMTFSDLKEHYLSYIKTRLRPSSYRKLDENINLYISDFFGNIIIKDITTNHIIKWHNIILKKEFSAKFSKAIHTTLVGVLNHGVKFFGLEKNVASLVGNFRFDNLIQKKEMSFLTYNEFNDFIEKEDNEVYRCFFTLLFYTGLRKGELWCLTWDDVDYTTNSLKINKAYNPKNGKIMPPKTKKSYRTIPMLNEALNAIKTMEKHKTDEYVFGTDKIKGTTLDRKCKKNCISAGITKNIRIHDFRHSFVSLCVEHNITIQLISNYVGHENITTTLDTYGHLYPNSGQKLVDSLNQFLNTRPITRPEN